MYIRSCYRRTFYILFTVLCIFVFPFCISAQPYFQQDVNYRISVTLDDKSNELTGFETIGYVNHSPDELNFIWMHLWPNGYKNNSTELAKQMLESGETKFYYADDYQRGSIDSLAFKVNGVPVKVEFENGQIDRCKLILNEPLKAGGNIVISTPFHVNIPEGIFSRLGHMGQSYQITQWYPKPAVYDRKGWHPLPYLNQGEFYSEFGSYDVSISLPKNYVVGATGDLTDNEAEQAWLEQKVRETQEGIEKEKSDILLSSKKADLSFPKSDTTFKKLRFVQSKVHDFAWFADKRYHVLKGEVELPVSKRKVKTWVMYTDSEKDLWEKSIDYVNDAVYYYSLWNGEYPYNHATAVDGALSAGGGMEYPNITVIGKSGSDYMLQDVIIHEVGHNWFYGILGSNEREHAWMDEGINSFNENRYMNMKYPPELSSTNASFSFLGSFGKLLKIDNLNNSNLLSAAYYMNAKKKLDQPIDMHAAAYTEINYGAVVYEKTALVFNSLKAYLGDSAFDHCMKAYFEEWKFKHPYPEDLKAIFVKETGKNLDWFFEDLIKTTNHVDYQLNGLKKSKNADGSDGPFEVTIKNKGGIASPFPISALRNDSLVETQWIEGFTGKKKLTVPFKNFDRLQIDSKKEMPELDRKNNSIRESGIFRKAEPIHFKFLGGLENPNKSMIYFCPLAGWNEYDNAMIGSAFYNSLIPPKNFEYVLAPMYGTGSKKLVGFGSAFYNVYFGQSLFQHLKIGMNARKFSEYNHPISLDYLKLAPELKLGLRKKYARSSVSEFIRFRNVNIIEQEPAFSVVENKTLTYQTSFYVNELSYQMNNKRKVHPYSAYVTLQQGSGFVKSMVEGNYRISYNKSKGMNIRFFSGKFLKNDGVNRVAFRMGGNNDYLKDNLYLGRNETTGLMSKQFALSEGGFKNVYSTLNADDWLTAVNLETSLPWKTPFKLYADAGLSNRSSNIEFTSGIAFTPIPGFLEVYFPLAMAKDLHQNNYGEKIRFVFNMNLLNPFEALNSVIE